MKRNILSLVVALSLLTTASAVTLGDKGWLVAAGSGSAEIDGTGTMQLSEVQGTVWFEDESKIDGIWMTGDWKKTYEGNSVKYKGTGSLDATFTGNQVKIEGKGLHIKVMGYGTLTVSGKGIHIATNKVHDLKLQAIAPVEVKTSEPFTVNFDVLNKGDYDEDTMVSFGLYSKDNFNWECNMPTEFMPIKVPKGMGILFTKEFTIPTGCEGEYVLSSNVMTMEDVYSIDNYEEDAILAVAPA